ncbi:MAG: ABC transporter permease, partial [Lachnospiraceae bacterium]|nr:ABC transporter permease [Lachnospiraceae bacterium]
INSDTAVTEETISELQKQHGMKDGGRTYGMSGSASEFVSEEWIRQLYSQWMSTEEIDIMLESYEQEGNLFRERVQLYGMEQFCLDKLTILEGDISKLYEEGNYVAAVYFADDCGTAEEGSNWAKPGDKVKIRYTDEWEYYDIETGEIFENPEEISESTNLGVRAKSYRDVEYEVAALVDVPHALSYRYYGADEFVLNAETFKKDTKTEDIMYYAYDMEKAVADTDYAEVNMDNMEGFLLNYTENVNSRYDYESKETYAAEFYGFRDMFMIMGSVLSFIVGLVGVLNFLNAILTGILARRREFAVLQSVGMTGKQLKQMLIAEGLYYTLGAVIISLVLNILLGPLVGEAMGSMFWFFTFKFTVTPILAVAPVFVVLGVVIPMITYHFAAKKSVVERLREAE